MATTVQGFERAAFDVFVGTYADDYAHAVAGHPLFDKDFDRAKYDEARKQFLGRVDTPEKLMKLAEAMTPPPCPECGRDF